MSSISKHAIENTRPDEEDQNVLSSIEDILVDLRAGKPVIIVDDEDRENEGDLIIAAEKATPENINFMAKEGRGLICLPMERAMIERLGLSLMGRGNNTHHRTAFTTSIEAKEGVTTGISAADRALTVQTAIDPKTGPDDIATPGHVFPLLARDGGVLERAGHTEAAVDLARMAGMSGAGVLCEIMNDDGSMARLDDLVGYAQKHALKIGTIADLISYRRRTESLVKRIHEDIFDSAHGGEFTRYLYATTIHYEEHIVLIKGDLEGEEPVHVRMHALNEFEDLLGAGEGSCLPQAMEMIAAEGRGVIVLLRNSDPKKLSGKLQDQKPDKALRNYGIGAQILRDLGVKHMILLTNSPKPVVGLEAFDLHIAAHKPIDAS